MPYPDAHLYDPASAEWRDICLARWICMRNGKGRKQCLHALRENHGKEIAKHIEQLARAQYEVREQWSPAHIRALGEHARRCADAAAADRGFLATYRFETEAEIAAMLTPAPRRADPVASADDGARARRRPEPEFELTP